MAPTLVESQLPRDFIYDLGLYLQTIAQIEYSICTLICALEALTEGSGQWAERHHQLRKLQQKELLTELRKAIRKLPDELAASFVELIHWIDTYKKNRHIAAHGAFYATDVPGVLKVHYTHATGEKSNPQYVPETAEITRIVSLELIGDADRILRNISEVRLAVQNGAISLRGS